MFRFFESKKRRERRERRIASFERRLERLAKHLAETEEITLTESIAFVNRVMLVLRCARGPVIESDFVPHFKMTEAAMVIIVLHHASYRFNIVKREVRWSLR